MDSAYSRGVLRFGLLGPVQAWRSDLPLDLGSPQQRAVLAALLLRDGRAVTASQLVEAVWGEDHPPRAVAALRTYVSRLRAVLEPDRPARVTSALLVSVADGYALKIDPGALDVTQFERLLAAAEQARAGDPIEAHALLRAALGLWHGTPLTGVPGPYAETQRDRLAERRLVALESRLDLDLELGRYAEAIGELTVLVTEHPLRERLRALLMLALYRAGRQAEALAAYTALRTVLIEELGIEPGPEAAALHARILAADPTLAPKGGSTPTTPKPDTVQTPPAVAPSDGDPRSVSAVRPAQLPADVADFTGRADLINRLTDALAAGATAVPLAAVIGVGGVGKTALAVHVAHELRDHFPDGQLYVNLRGADTRPAEPAEVLSSLLRALGVADDVIPEAQEHRAAFFRSTLAGRRILVVLDNARDTLQIRPLLPGTPGCAVVITSRNAMADLPGARFVDLGVLPAEDALALFARIAGADRVAAELDAAREVVAACGLLPLAVRIVASRLNTRPAWSIVALAARLGDERRRLDELRIGNLAVESSFQLSYAQLREDQGRAFRLLAVPDVPDLSLATAAALLDRDEMTAEDLCESLVDACLLESPAPGRYRFHDLVKLYARRQGQQPERAAALSRLLDYYIATVSHLLRMRTPGTEPAEHLMGTRARGVPLADLEAAQRWLARERTGLFAAVYQAALEPGGPVALAMYLVLAMCECVDADGARGDAEWAMAALMGSAVFSGAPTSLKSVQPGRLSAPLLPRGSRGQIRQMAGAAQLTEAYALLESTGDPRMTAWSAFLRGAAALLSGDAEAAVRFHVQAIGLLENVGESWGDGMLYSLMIKAYRDAGSFTAGSAMAERALAVARRGADRATEAFTLHELGLLTMLAGDPSRAVRECRQALELARSTGRRTREGYALLRLAQTLLGAGQVGEAAEVGAAAVRVLTEATDPSQRAVALAVLAEALDALGDSEGARQNYREAAEVFARLGLPSAADLYDLADPSEA